MSAGGALSDRHALRTARGLRFASLSLEAVVWLVLAGSALGFGAVHEFVYVPLWLACGALVPLLALRSRLLVSLRRRAGPQRVTFHASGRWLVLGDDSAYGGATGWSLDLARPALPRGPLLLPGLAFAGYVTAQLLTPWLGIAAADAAGGWLPSSIAPAASGRGLVFVLALLALHAAAAALLDGRAARARFRSRLALLGALLSAIGLVQYASGSPAIYGVFQPFEWQGGQVRSFGPFINRNHFAAWMLLAVPLACGELMRALARYRRHSGQGVNLRRRLLSLQSPSGSALLLAGVPALVCVAGLVAANSRGGALAFLGALALAVLLRRGRGNALAPLVPLALFGLALSWFGPAQLGARFERAFDDSLGRTAVWSDTVARIDGLWRTGSGFNTFQFAMGRTSAWSLPEGATPWSEAEAGVLQPAAGFYVPDGARGWFREAHDEYLQLLVECGLPGLALLAWALAASLAARRGDAWSLAALLGPLLHSLVDFPLQIPAVAALFVTIAALPARAVE